MPSYTLHMHIYPHKDLKSQALTSAMKFCSGVEDNKPTCKIHELEERLPKGLISLLIYTIPSDSLERT